MFRKLRTRRRYKNMAILYKELRMSDMNSLCYRRMHAMMVPEIYNIAPSESFIAAVYAIGRISFYHTVRAIRRGEFE